MGEATTSRGGCVGLGGDATELGIVLARVGNLGFESGDA